MLYLKNNIFFFHIESSINSSLINCMIENLVKFTLNFLNGEIISNIDLLQLSTEIWNKFIGNQQTEETYKKKMLLWKYLYIFIKVLYFFKKNIIENHVLKYFTS